MSSKTCFNCGQPGHIARYCNADDDDDDDEYDEYDHTDDQNNFYEETRTCNRCHQRGHIAPDCNQTAQQKQCYRCKGFGHIARNCIVNPSRGGRNGVDHLQKFQGNKYPAICKIQIRKGYLTNQDVDVIVVCSSSDGLRESVLQAAGPFVQKAYKKRDAVSSESETFALKCPNLPCREIFFREWTPCDQNVLTEQTIKDFITEAIEYVLSRNYVSVAFPSIGCGEFGLDADLIAQIMINHVKIEKYPLNVVFIIHPLSHNVFTPFQNAIASTAIIDMLPDTLVYTENNDNLRLPVGLNTDEYNIIVEEFNKTMFNRYRKINRIERIQNERWHKQYLVHRNDFKKRLKMNTEKFLYHGCSNIAADSIIEEYFNRSFAGANGTVYGNGVYFSSRAAYSHSYALPNNGGERCMFFARVLVGYSILGDNTMKVCPRDFHTTTDGEHIYVTYHDTQAYGQYLIRYQ